MANSVINNIVLRNASGQPTTYDIGANAENVIYESGISVKTKIDVNETNLNGHVNSKIGDTSLDGVHGFKYEANQLKVYNPSTGQQETISHTSGTDIPIGDVIGATATLNGTTVVLKWSDPEDIILSGIEYAKWMHTVVCLKAGSAPQSPTDCITSMTNVIRNQYASEGFTGFQNLDPGETYYVRFFPAKRGETGSPVYTNGTGLLVEVEDEKINVPSPVSSFVYDGTEKTVQQNNYNAEKMTKAGTESATEAGTYTVVFTPKAGYQQNDGTTTSKNVNQYIATSTIAAPTVSGDSSFIYDTLTKTLNISGYSSETMNKTGTESAINVGEYSVTISLKDKESNIWSDGTSEDKVFNQSINKRAILVAPTVSGTYPYNGLEQTLVLSYSNASYTDANNVSHTVNTSSYTSVTDNKGTNVGDYTAICSINNDSPYKQATGSETDLPISQSIVKGTASATASTSFVTLDKDHTSVTVTISNIVGGTLGIPVSNNDNVAVASLSGNILTINSVNNVSGNAIITLPIIGNENYNNGSVTINVTASFIVLVTQTSGSDADVLGMIDSYYSGDLTLADIQSVQSVGDNRICDNNLSGFQITSHSAAYRIQDEDDQEQDYSTTIPNQYMQIDNNTTIGGIQKIIDFNHDNLSSSIGGKTKALITIMTCPVSYDSNNAVYMSQRENDSGLPTSYYDSNSLRAYFEYNFDSAIRSTTVKDKIKRIEKEVQIPTYGGSLVTIDVKSFAVSYAEVFGSAENQYKPLTDEGSQYSYFSISSANKIINEGFMSQGTYKGNTAYQLRSMCGKTGYTDMPLYVLSGSGIVTFGGIDSYHNFVVPCICL